MKKPLMPNHYPVNRNGLALWVDYRNSGKVPALGTAKDYSGKSNNIALNGSAHIDNKGLSLNGTSDYGEILNDDLGLSNEASFSFWLKPNSAPANGDCFFEKYSSSGDQRALIFDALGSTSLRFWISANGINAYQSILSFNFEVGVWQHMTLTFKNGIIALYKNGVLVDSDTNTATSLFNSTSPLVIGYRKYSGGGYLDATMSNIMILNRELSPGENKVNYLRDLR